MKRVLSISIKVVWRTMDKQGPQHEPNVSHDAIFSNVPLLMSDIEEIVRERYGPFIDDVSITQLQLEGK